MSTHSYDIHQEGKHNAVSHNSAKYVTTFGLLGVIGVKIPSKDIDFTYTGGGGTKHHHPMGTIKHKEKEVGKKDSVDNGSSGTIPPQLDNGILGISTAGLKDPANYIEHSATVDDNNNGWEDEKDRELAAALALTRARGFSVDVSLDQIMHKSGAEECELLRAKKVATELHQGCPSSSAVTHQDDDVVKAAACPENFEAPSTGVHNIALGGLIVVPPSQKSRCNTGRGAWEERAKCKNTSLARDIRSFGSSYDGYAQCHQEGGDSTGRQA